MKDMILGIDIGGTKIRAVLWDGQSVIAVSQFETPQSSNIFKKTITHAVKLLIYSKSRQSIRIFKIGIGVAGVINVSTRVKSPNIKYMHQFNLINFLNKVLQSLGIKAKIKLDNDARCFLRAEINAVPHLNKGRILGITLGTGIGRALARNGKVLKIKKFEYPEQWEARYQKVRDKKNDSKLADFLAQKLTILISARKPRTIVVGGGVSNRKHFVSLLRGALRQRGLAVRVFKSRLGQDSVAIGAALISDISSI